MAFEPNKWVDGEAGGTPITAAELNRIEAAGAAKAAKGQKGDPGKDGADGFPSQSQWEALVARVEALEAAAG